MHVECVCDWGRMRSGLGYRIPIGSKRRAHRNGVKRTAVGHIGWHGFISPDVAAATAPVP